MASPYRVNPRVRAYGKARIDVTRRAQDERDWQRKWHAPLNTFPFEFSSGWRHCVEYRVDDFAAEVGFFIDVLGFPVLAFSESYAQFTSPGLDYYFSVAAARQGEDSTPPEAIRLQFQVDHLEDTVGELERRGIEFELRPSLDGQVGQLSAGYFRTPHGVCIDLIGFVETVQPAAAVRMEAAEEDEPDDPTADDPGAGESDSYADIWDLVGAGANQHAASAEVEQSPVIDELDAERAEDNEAQEADPPAIVPATVERQPALQSRSKKRAAASDLAPHLKEIRRRDLPLRNGVFDWSLKKDRASGEPTYTQIEDDITEYDG